MYTLLARQLNRYDQLLKSMLVSADPALRERIPALSKPRLVIACPTLEPSEAVNANFATLYTLCLLARRIHALTAS